MSVIVRMKCQSSNSDSECKLMHVVHNEKAFIYIIFMFLCRLVSLTQCRLHALFCKTCNALSVKLARIYVANRISDFYSAVHLLTVTAWNNVRGTFGAKRVTWYIFCTYVQNVSCNALCTKLSRTERIRLIRGSQSYASSFSYVSNCRFYSLTWLEVH